MPRTARPAGQARRRAATPEPAPEPPAAISPFAAEAPVAEPPKRPTRARLQTYFLRRLAISGSVLEAAAQAGTTPRTVRRWRNANPAFARRYEETLAGRLEILQDLAMRRALGADHRPVFHRGKQIASIERHNDAMLMRLLARFDRLRERQALQTGVRSNRRQEDIVDVALLEASSERARQRARQEAIVREQEG